MELLRQTAGVSLAEPKAFIAKMPIGQSSSQGITPFVLLLCTAQARRPGNRCDRRRRGPQRGPLAVNLVDVLYFLQRYGNASENKRKGT